MNTVAPEVTTAPKLAELMHSDALLPGDVFPGGESAVAGHAVLVTGATGFLGRYIVRELLERPGLDIVCLVRAASVAQARERLRLSLATARVDWSRYQHRLQVLAGAIEQPQLGLDDEAYQGLARQVGGIYHCAADVSWSRGYRRLRASNVLGTLELIRLACSGPLKRVNFVSTISVCFATPGPATIHEGTDMLPYVEQMPLPYAQSKCVAESLLRRAAERGVPVSIVRPALISGDSLSGDANPDDLISALIQGCVVSGAAIDSDWRLDCVPVDYVARVLVTLGASVRPDWEVLNLFNDHSRHWREVVLWMNLYGYPVRLVPHQEWLQRTFERATSPPVLFGYRRFFGAASQRFPGPAPYATYLGNAQQRVRNDVTRQTLATLGVEAPPLDVMLMERYLAHYAAMGVVPRPARQRAAVGQGRAASSTLQEAIGEQLQDRQLTLLDVREQPFASVNGIFNEVTSARLGGHIGIRRYDITVRDAVAGSTRTLGVLLKSKPADTLMEDVLVQVATLCDAELGAHCERFKRDLGLAGCHERELALYELPEPRLQRHMPAVFGTHRDSCSGTWSVAMEYWPAAETVDAATTAWTPRQLSGVLRGLADVHAIWYQRDATLRGLPWVVPPPDTTRMLEMAPLWHSLAEHGNRYFSPWLAAPLLPLQRRLIASLGDWWPALRALPQTLVHNDFNPRNLVLRANGAGVSAGILDWELATMGVPQHDLAELLCFVLAPGCDLQTLSRVLEWHRAALESAAGVAIDRREWVQGFVFSLRYLMVYRLPLYTLMHRFRQQAFLPRVIRNGVDLYRLSSELAGRPAQHADQQSARHNEYRGNELVLRPDPQRAAYVEADDVRDVRNIQ